MLLKKGMLKEGIRALLHIGTARISRGKKREKDGKRLEPSRPKGFIKKRHPKALVEGFIKKHPGC